MAAHPAHHIIQIGPMPAAHMQLAPLAPMAPADRVFFTDLAGSVVLQTLLSFMPPGEVAVIGVDNELGRALSNNPAFNTVSHLLPFVRAAQGELDNFRNTYGGDPTHANAFADPQLVDLYREVRNAQGCGRRAARLFMAALLINTVTLPVVAGAFAYSALTSEPGDDTGFRIGVASVLSGVSLLAGATGGVLQRETTQNERADMACVVADEIAALQAGVNSGLRKIQAQLAALDPERSA
ncbi:MAG: hypothetical protein H7255_02700 [Ramlibacter sp.]|nr:hypothetical protein [Ramlibacter sp.]